MRIDTCTANNIDANTPLTVLLVLVMSLSCAMHLGLDAVSRHYPQDQLEIHSLSRWCPFKQQRKLIASAEVL